MKREDKRFWQGIVLMIPAALLCWIAFWALYVLAWAVFT